MSLFFHLYALRNLFSHPTWPWTSRQIEDRWSSNETLSAPERRLFLHIYTRGLWDQEAMTMLMALVLGVSAVWVGCLLVPARPGQRRRRVDWATAGFFSCIGLGFMLFESSQLQRLSLFLGNPVYALTVVLFCLLLSSALGAWRVRKVARPRGVHAVSLLVVLVLAGFSTPAALGRRPALLKPCASCWRWGW